MRDDFTVRKGYVVTDRFGRAVDYFDTEEEAQEYADELNEEKELGIKLN